MKKSKILLAEDDVNLGTILKEYLEAKNYLIDHKPDGAEALNSFMNSHYNLCLIDIMMPKMDGFTLARKIREKDEKIPIIFLTAKSLQTDKAEGFNIGADDYITKPFSTEELLLRINAVLRRTEYLSNVNEDIQIFKIGNSVFEPLKQLLTINNKKIRLTTKENDLLHLLALNKNRIVDRSVALNKIWGADNYFNSRSMDVYISRLRNHLKGDKNLVVINIHGKGFKLSVEESIK
ncbi:MAG: response regulator transcription factor [Melioribacteraceae bacterium]|nr:response regulator transcription factor [Melioribacteraceae bacterium]